jgi:hypothetical protein
LSSQNFWQCKSTATQNYSPLAIRYSLPFRLGRNFAFPLFALQKSHPPVANCQLPFAFTIRHSLPFRLRVVKAVCYSPLAVRHSLFSTRYSPFQKFSPAGKSPHNVVWVGNPSLSSRPTDFPTSRFADFRKATLWEGRNMRRVWALLIAVVLLVLVFACYWAR